jgi:hypothetical protein
MKPVSPSQKPAGFPRTDFCFQSDLTSWRGFWSPSGDEGESDGRRFYNFTREFLLESARERAKEMAVFGLMVVVAAWPVGYMVYIVVKLLIRDHLFDR